MNVVHASAESIASFDHAYFAGYRSMRALTYTSSIPMIADLVAKQRFDEFECIFGHGGILSREAAQILAFQHVVRDKLAGAIIGVKGLREETREAIYRRVADDEMRFFVVKDAIAHAKIYLLQGAGKTRVIVGSANLSERAFSGRQAETLIVFDDDETAWHHYLAQYEAVPEAGPHRPGRGAGQRPRSSWIRGESEPGNRGRTKPLLDNPLYPFRGEPAAGRDDAGVVRAHDACGLPGTRLRAPQAVTGQPSWPRPVPLGAPAAGRLLEPQRRQDSRFRCRHRIHPNAGRHPGLAARRHRQLIRPARAGPKTHRGLSSQAHPSASAVVLAADMNARKQFGDYRLDGLLSIDLVGEDAFVNGSGNGCIESVEYFEEGLIFANP